MRASDSTEVLVVGGGIHGVGAAQAAAAAGYEVLLIEKSDLAAGTSSRSSKLIHGGLRYLESGQWRLVMESLQERERLLRIAPQLVKRQPFYVPIYPQTKRRPWALHLGLSAYHALAGWRAQTGYRRCTTGEWSALDGLSTRGLQSVFQFWDAQTDDRLLTQSVMDSAQSLQACWWRGAELVHGELRDDLCRCRVRVGSDERIVDAQVVVNAAGPWASALAERISPSLSLPAVDLVQGTHLELSGIIERGCYYIEAPSDRRAVFVMPWHDRTLVGTTERVFHGRPEEVAPTAEETDYLVKVVQHYFPERSTEIVASWAGLRVLPRGDGAAFGRLRETQLIAHPTKRPRFITILGGKLTAYRATSERVVRMMQPTLPHRRPRADTRTLMLNLPASSRA